MGLTEGHWFEDEEQLTERQLERAIADEKSAYERGLRDGKRKSNWISVKDRLPPLDTEVLVFSHGNISVCSLIRSDQEVADVVWEDAYGYWDDDEGVAAVTHWMPLPEPPKEG